MKEQYEQHVANMASALHSDHELSMSLDHSDSNASTSYESILPQNSDYGVGSIDIDLSSDEGKEDIEPESLLHDYFSDPCSSDTDNDNPEVEDDLMLSLA